METKMWLVRIAALAVVGSTTWSAGAQAKPDDESKPADDSEGPFAPKGKTGRLREAPTPVAKAEEAPPPPEKRGMALLDIVYGFGSHSTGPDDTFDLAVASFVVGGAYQVTPAIGLRLRVPFATGKITEAGDPSGGYNTATFGNVEVAGNYTLDLGAHTKLPIELAFTPPTSNGDRFGGPEPEEVAKVRHFRLNTAALVARGMEDDALFAPHRFGITPGARLRFHSGALDTGAFLKVPILIRAGGEDPRPPAMGHPDLKPNSTVIEVVAGGQIFYGVLADKIDIGLRAWAAAMSDEYIDATLPGGTAPDKFQFVLEPQVRGCFGPVRAALGFLWPIGGRLGGDKSSDGLRIDLGTVF
jgi:hypothetical protein